MQQPEFTALSNTALLAQLAELDRKQSPRLLQQLRAELVQRGVRYSEQQIPGSRPPRYQIEQIGTATQSVVQSPLIEQDSPPAYGIPWWALFLILLNGFCVFVLWNISGDILQPVNVCYGISIFAFILLSEYWLLHSRQHNNYLASRLTDQYPPLSATRQRLCLYSCAVLIGFALTSTLSLLGHRVSAVPLQQQVLLLDVRRDYDEPCKFRLLLHFSDNNSRYLCVPTEIQYEELRPNDRLQFQGDWSFFGVTGQVKRMP
jgi:hypothetical protein